MSEKLKTSVETLPQSAVDAKGHWRCTCDDPPLLLAVITKSGDTVLVKVRDRYWLFESGVIVAGFPRCGVEHTYDARSKKITSNDLGHHTGAVDCGGARSTI